MTKNENFISFKIQIFDWFVRLEIDETKDRQQTG